MCRDREATELDKLELESHKLNAERHKLNIERKKLLREYTLYPWFIAAICTTAAAAVLKLLLDQL